MPAPPRLRPARASERSEKQSDPRRGQKLGKDQERNDHRDRDGERRAGERGAVEDEKGQQPVGRDRPALERAGKLVGEERVEADAAENDDQAPPHRPAHRVDKQDEADDGDDQRLDRMIEDVLGKNSEARRQPAAEDQRRRRARRRDERRAPRPRQEGDGHRQRQRDNQHLFGIEPPADPERGARRPENGDDRGEPGEQGGDGRPAARARRHRRRAFAAPIRTIIRPRRPSPCRT